MSNTIFKLKLRFQNVMFEMKARIPRRAQNNFGPMQVTSQMLTLFHAMQVSLIVAGDVPVVQLPFPIE